MSNRDARCGRHARGGTTFSPAAFAASMRPCSSMVVEFLKAQKDKPGPDNEPENEAT
jgi:hypothetical protein